MESALLEASVQTPVVAAQTEDEEEEGNVSGFIEDSDENSPVCAILSPEGAILGPEGAPDI